MKLISQSVLVVVVSISLVSCATSSAQPKNEIAGPVIMNPRVQTSVVEVTSDLKHADSPDVVAEVKDPSHKITGVILKVTYLPEEYEQANVANFKPIVIKMEHLEGTTWGVKFSDEDLAKLAVNGKDMVYEARVLAKNDADGISQSNETLQIKVRAPSVAKVAS